MTEFKPEKKYKHLAKLSDIVLTCISCGDCREATDITDNTQKWGVCVAREHSPGFEPYFSRGKMQIIRSIWQGKLNLSKRLGEVIYQCPTCNACAEVCSYEMDNAALYEALRAELVDAGCGLEAHVPMNNAMVELLNPYGRDNKEKAKWTEQLDFKIKNANSEQAEVLYFVGCTASLTDDIRSVAINTAKVLKKLNVDFSIFGENEVCCGSVAMRTGERKAFASVAEKNMDLFRKSGVKTIITSCAGCFRTLKIDYTKYFEGLGIEILHTIEFIHKLINEKNIQLKNLGLSTTYHDPCHTGRHTGVYEEPREILKKMASLTEMKTIKENAKCCGAGGGVKKGFPELSLKIAKSRIQEAEETGAEYLVSICPFCYRNLSDAIKELGSSIKMIDLMELLNQALDQQIMRSNIMSFKRNLDEIKQKKEEMVTSVFKGAEMLWVLWETKKEVIERVLPPPLEPLERPIALAFVANYPSHSYGLPYTEAALLIRCQYKGELGNYFLSMPLTDDRATFAGREIWGFPKKLANVHFEKNGNELYGYSERLGTKNIEVRLKLTGKFNDEETPKIVSEIQMIPKRGKGTINYLFKHFIHPTKEGFDYNPWLVKQTTKSKIKTMQMGEAEIKLNSTIHDPWGEIEIVRVLGGMYLQSENEMFPGEVLTEVDPEEFLPYSYIKWDWY